MIKEKTPEWHAEMSHPNNDYMIDMVKDEIFTLEGIHAGMPYGSSSGKWGNSGKMWTEQHGTPIGADLTYYASYDNAFYRLKVDFPVEKMKDLVKRRYAFAEVKGKTIEEYKYEGDPDLQFSMYDSDTAYESYDAFTSLIFGFAPKGMVVVWVNYGLTVIEIGRYQAKVITDQQELNDSKEIHLRTWRFTPEYFDELAAKKYNPNANCKLWDMYRVRYQWKPVFSSENAAFRIFEVNTEYYNAEKDQMLRPWLLENKMRDRALPRVMQFFWETAKEEKFEGRIFFNRDELFERFKTALTENEIQIKIAEDNRSIEVLLNGQVLKVDSIRIYPNSDYVFNESYK
ncbi:DUF2931 family protein [Flavobacterium sp. 17A]|uniref:DUF2931 family protein n=1 Tax=Flavobacterium potami TaxID=2872310 RepID=A0A9X1HET3_9FLAO|nr:DUF2931 family protein [Flavobacterium potami]MBZ4037318.1 DUF2931 family protein [Flavobacterium potami]